MKSSLKTPYAWRIRIYVNVSVRIQLYNVFQDLYICMYKKKYITSIFDCDSVTLVFINNILNIFIICIKFNETYIIPNFGRTAMKCDRTIGLTLNHIKWNFIWSFIFESTTIIDHVFISNFIVMVYYFNIFQILSLIIYV